MSERDTALVNRLLGSAFGLGPGEVDALSTAAREGLVDILAARYTRRPGSAGYGAVTVPGAVPTLDESRRRDGLPPLPPLRGDDGDATSTMARLS